MASKWKMSSVKKQTILPPLTKIAQSRKEKIAKKIADSGTSGKSMDLESIQRRRAKLEEMTNAYRNTAVGKRTAFSKASSVHLTLPRPISSVRLAPIEHRQPNELDKKKQNTVLKRPKSSHKTTVPPEKHETWKDEEELLQLWKKQNRLNDIDRRHNDPDAWIQRDRQERGKGKKLKKTKEVKIKNPEIEEIPRRNSGIKREKKREKQIFEERLSDDEDKEDEANNDDKDELSKNIQLEDIRNVISKMKTMTDEERLAGAYVARKHLSLMESPPIQQYIEEGALPPLINCLKSSNPSLQFEASWAITNISAGTTEHAKAVYESGAIPVLITLLESPYSRVADQAVWSIGNLLGDSDFTWEKVIEAGCIKPLYGLIDRSPSVTALRNISWSFSNILRYKNLTISPADLKLCIKAVRLFLHHPDKEIHLNACWSLVYLTDSGTTELLDCVIKAGILPRLVELLEHRQLIILTPVIRVLGNIMTGTDDQTDRVLSAGVVPHFVDMLKHSSIDTRRDAAWALSNITGGTEEQIQMVMDTDAIPTLIQIMDMDRFEVSKEAAWCISNLTEGGSQSQTDTLVEQGAVRPLANLIHNQKESTLLQVVLEGLKNILEDASETSEVKASILDVVPLTKFDELISSSDIEISKLAARIKEKLSDS